MKFFVLFLATFVLLCSECSSQPKNLSTQNEVLSLKPSLNSKERTIELYLNPYDPITRMAAKLWSHIFVCKNKGKLTKPATTSTPKPFTPTNTVNSTIEPEVVGAEQLNMDNMNSSSTPDEISSLPSVIIDINDGSTISELETTAHSELETEMTTKAVEIGMNSSTTEHEEINAETPHITGSSEENITSTDSSMHVANLEQMETHTTASPEQNISSTMTPSWSTSSEVTIALATISTTLPNLDPSPPQGQDQFTSSTLEPGTSTTTQSPFLANNSQDSKPLPEQNPQETLPSHTQGPIVEQIPQNPSNQFPGPNQQGQFPNLPQEPIFGQNPNGQQPSGPLPGQFPNQNPGINQQGPPPFPQGQNPQVPVFPGPNQQSPPYPGQSPQGQIPQGPPQFPGQFPGQNQQIPPSQFPVGQFPPIGPQQFPNQDQLGPPRPPKNPFATPRPLSTGKPQIIHNRDQVPSNSTNVLSNSSFTYSNQINSNEKLSDKLTLPIEEKRRLSHLHRIYAIIHGEGDYQHNTKINNSQSFIQTVIL